MLLGLQSSGILTEYVAGEKHGDAVALAGDGGFSKRHAPGKGREVHFCIHHFRRSPSALGRRRACDRPLALMIALPARRRRQ